MSVSKGKLNGKIFAEYWHFFAWEKVWDIRHKFKPKNISFQIKVKFLLYTDIFLLGAQSLVKWPFCVSNSSFNQICHSRISELPFCIVSNVH